MFWASLLEVLQISRAPTITLPAFVIAEKFILPSFPTTRPSVAAFACIMPRSISMASSSTSTFDIVPDSQKLTLRMTFRISAGVAVEGRGMTILLRFAGNFLYKVLTCVSREAVDVVQAEKYLSTKSPQLSVFALANLANLSSAESAGSGQAAVTVSLTTLQ